MNNQSGFQRLPAVLDRVPFSKSSLYAMVAAGLFPRPHRIGARAVAWLQADVDGWIKERSKGPSPVPASPRPPTGARPKHAATAADQQSA